MDGVERMWESGKRMRRNVSRSMRMSGSGSDWGVEDVFARSQRERFEDDEESLRWAALEKLPTYDRLRTSIIMQTLEDNHNKMDVDYRQVDVRKLGFMERQAFIDRLINVADEDNEKFLRNLRNRIDRVGIQLPTVEVRFQHLTVDAECYVGSRALPTLWNTAKNLVEYLFGMVGLTLTKKINLTILKEASGVLKPSRMTLLLGPPGSGKTSLLLALAGKLDPGLKVRGEITYNGYTLDEFVPQKTSAYISQHDLHVGEMTVRETLDFSARCQGVGDRFELLAELARREKQAGIFPEADVDLFMKATAMEGLKSGLQTDYILKILGLDVCGDTIVGNDMQRGISGGQKKRVTTGEMIVGPTKTLFMDEISTGLDSSTTYQIVKCLQHFTNLMDATILMSLLQPAPEIFDLFDDIILLSEGQIIYHGPRENVLEFFESCGFKCPERKGTADFLQEVTSKKDQEQYWEDKKGSYRYIPVKEFVLRFKQFHSGLHLENELSVSYDKKRSHRAALVFDRNPVPKMEIFKACFSKEWLLVKRNSFVYIFKTTQIIVGAFITSTVFLKTEMHHKSRNDANIYLGALIFSLLANMFNGFAELAMTIVRLPVFFKQRDLLFYPAWAFTIPTFLLRIPMSVLEAGVWVLITYYTTGFTPEASRFFRQFLVIFLVHQMASSLFRLMAGVFRTMILANTGGFISLLLIFMLGGFILPRENIPKWWIWGYWCSPLMYAENAISVNEMLAPRWMISAENTTNLGVSALKSRNIFPQAYWYWLGVAALLGFSVLFNVLFTLALAYLKPLGKPQAVISKEELEEMQAQENDSKQGHNRKPSRSRRGSSADDNNAFEMQISGMSNQSTSLEGNNELGLEAAAATGVPPKRGMILPFKALAMSFEDVNYFVDMPLEMKEQGVTDDRLQLLRDVTGAFRPGVLTALMGVSGAGKTTLMDVLAGRKTGGYIEGDIRISGFPKSQETFARISGYCEQNDIHSPQVTVRESLLYSAFLRLPKDVDKETRTAFVHEVIELVELDNLRDALVGLPGISGLSTEQRKRLTIAVELVANPSIIFMDEPTSGLDARAAAIVMRTVRNTVDTGRTVVCTIHQPSIDIFEAFDELLLMKRGGKVIFFGPLGRNSHKVVEYFEAIPGVPKIKDKYNPATWMLEVSSIAAEHGLGIDFAEHYKKSSLYMRNRALVTELKAPCPDAKDLYFATQYSQSFFGQFNSCLWKQWWTYWRSPDYNAVRYFFTLVCALLLGTIFWKVAKEQRTRAMADIMLHMRHLEDECQRAIKHIQTVEFLLREKKKVLKSDRSSENQMTQTSTGQEQYAIEVESADSCSVVDRSIELNMPRFMSPTACSRLRERAQDRNCISPGKEIKREERNGTRVSLPTYARATPNCSKPSIIRQSQRNSEFNYSRILKYSMANNKGVAVIVSKQGTVDESESVSEFRVEDDHGLRGPSMPQRLRVSAGPLPKQLCTADESQHLETDINNGMKQAIVPKKRRFSGSYCTKCTTDEIQCLSEPNVVHGLRCSPSTSNKRATGSPLKQFTTDDILQSMSESCSPECIDGDQISSPVPNIKKQASFRKRILSNEHSTNSNSLENGHRSKQNSRQSPVNASPRITGTSSRAESKHGEATYYPILVKVETWK